MPNITMDPHVRIPSTWKDGVGKLLTNTIITRYQRQGWYGPVMKERASRHHEKNTSTTRGLVHRCSCGTTKEVKYVKWSYLPQAGFYCPRCIATHRKEKDMEKELARRVKEKMQAVFV